MGTPQDHEGPLGGRSLLLGALLGALLSGIELSWLGPHPAAGAAGALVAAGLSVGGYGLCALALASLSERATRLPERVRAWTAGAPLALGVGAHLGCLGVRAAAGDYPTWASLQMLWQSPAQLVGEALAGYRAALTGAAAVTLALAIAWPWLLSALPRPSARASRRAATGLAAVLVLAAGLGAAVPATLRHGHPLTAALLSRTAGEAPADGAGPARPPTITQGPSRSAEAAWLKRVAAGPDRRPSFLLVVLESVPANHLGYAGYPRPVTPHLDRIAAASLRFPRTWSVATQSNYAQMAILSSLHPRRETGLDTYERLDYPRVLPHDVFARLGYATATISSQNEDWQGMKRFQTTDTPTTFRDARDHPGPHIGTGTEQKLPDHLTVDVAIEWLEQVGDRPFALYVNLQRTHFPYQLPEGVEAPFQPADPDPARFGYLGYPRSELRKAINRYDNALAYVDAQVGRLYDHLASRGRLADTLLVVVADHGEAFHQRGQVTHGKSLQEAEARVPLLFHYPGVLDAGEDPRIASTLDLMPSVLAVLGLPPHPSYQGRSLLEPPAEPAQAVIMTLQGLRYADAILCWPYKLVHEASHKRLSLFDLARDPGEEQNLIEPRHPAARALGPLLLSHIRAQLAYHADASAMATRFAPRLPPCPSIQQ